MNSFQRRAALAAAVFGTFVAGCSSGPQGPSPQEAKVYMRGLDGRTTELKPGTDVNALYAEAMALKTKGDCTKAVPKLRQVANLGPGYEGAQTALGECLLQGDTASLSEEYLEGLTWLRRAADSGWPEAQGRLAYAHAVGPQTIRNGDEAAYWLALYLTNTGKSRVGFVPMPEDQLAAIDAALPASAKAAGAKRADTWQRKVWMPPVTAASTGPTAKPVQRPRLGFPPDDTQ